MIATPSSSPLDLDETRLAAWRAFLTAHAAVVARIEQDLAAAGEGVVPLSWYDVLIELREAPMRRLRQRDLARQVLLTRSGMSRLIDRLEAAGLVGLEPNPEDRRGDLVVLNNAGLAALRRTWPIYASSIAAHFARHLSPAAARVIADALQEVANASRPE